MRVNDIRVCVRVCVCDLDTGGASLLLTAELLIVAILAVGVTITFVGVVIADPAAITTVLSVGRTRLLR